MIQIANRQHVGPMQAEHEKHLGGPPPDALHLRQRHHHRFVVELLDSLQRDLAARELVGQVTEVERFLTAHADAAELFLGNAPERFGRHLAVGQEPDQPAINGRRRFGGELLKDDARTSAEKWSTRRASEILNAQVVVSILPGPDPVEAAGGARVGSRPGSQAPDHINPHGAAADRPGRRRGQGERRRHPARSTKPALALFPMSKGRWPRVSEATAPCPHIGRFRGISESICQDGAYGWRPALATGVAGFPISLMGRSL